MRKTAVGLSGALAEGILINLSSLTQLVEVNALLAQGALMGLFAGDAAGATLAGDTYVRHEDARRAMEMPGGGKLRLGPGQVSHASEMAMALAAGLIDDEMSLIDAHFKKLNLPHSFWSKVPPAEISDYCYKHTGLDEHGDNIRFPAEAVAEQYRAWYNWSKPPFDVGTTISSALAGLQEAGSNGVNPSVHVVMERRAAAWSMASLCSGALMRVVPLTIWAAGAALNMGAQLDEHIGLDGDIRAHTTSATSAALRPILDRKRLLAVANVAKQDGRMTHPNAIAQDANAAYAVAMAHLLTHPDDTGGAIAAASSVITTPQVRSWLDHSAASDVVDLLDCTSQMGHVRHAFTLAFHFLRRRTPFYDGVFMTLLKGGHTNTNGAIVGGLLGALHGSDGIPAFMKEAILAYDCSNESWDSIGRMRPSMFCPQFKSEYILERLLSVQPENMEGYEHYWGILY